MWLQMTLQQSRYRATGAVIQNRNAIHYGGPPDTASTTSYITMVWSPERIPASALPGDAWYFGGDTHFGRFVAEKLADPAAGDAIASAILAVTEGRPLILNLEGVMLDAVPQRPPGRWKILMARELTLTWLKRLAVNAAVLANNHTSDAGPAKFAAMRRVLESSGLRCAGQGEILEFPAFRLACATDLDNNPSPRGRLITPELVAAWAKPSDRRPLFAFLHSGTEYGSDITPRQEEIARLCEGAGAVLVTGCHPHRPSPAWTRTAQSLRRFSLGNLLFDQKDPENSGALLEVRFFAQGTWAARWHHTGNLFASTP
jgi:poly-gamma-glutamate synthesis protein (capsule biosynthesis protein)